MNKKTLILLSSCFIFYKVSGAEHSDVHTTENSNAHPIENIDCNIHSDSPEYEKMIHSCVHRHAYSAIDAISGVSARQAEKLTKQISTLIGTGIFNDLYEAHSGVSAAQKASIQRASQQGQTLM